MKAFLFVGFLGIQLSFFCSLALGQDNTVTGTVTDAESGGELPGVNIAIQGTTIGTTTNADGEYSLDVPSLDETLVFSYVGYSLQEVAIDGRTTINVSLAWDAIERDELVVVGYGVQQRSDITGSVASLSRERLEMSPNINVSQAIQGAIPGASIRTTSAGAQPSESIMIRGRNSITASNSPLIVVDGVSYSGNINDINSNDVESIEILKDASAAAIYGSRGANGVILITTKGGVEGETRISYNGHFSNQSHANLPELMDGQQFYDFKREREPGVMFASEQENYDAGRWTDWYDVGMRNGYNQRHDLSVSGGFGNTSFYISGGLLDVQGLAKNDDFMRASSRLNIDTKIADWLSIGTRTQLSYRDASGSAPNFNTLYHTNPLGSAYDAEGNIPIHPVPEYPVAHPLQETLYDNTSHSQRVVTNNFVNIEVPFVEGLEYRLNTGINFGLSENSTYRGMNTYTGLSNQGSAALSNSQTDDILVENILSYDTQIGVHDIFTTGLISYETNSYKANSLSARGFPHDILTWHSIPQADVISPSSSTTETTIQSQMLRVNYAYDSTYLITLTGRRDGYSGFGSVNKWGFFPSVALGWNLGNEEFFPWNDLFSQLKLRGSIGLNGNQAIGPYQTLASMSSSNYVDGNSTLAGYRPSGLGIDNLGWESSRTINAGLDYSLLDGRFNGDINLYRTNTFDLLLNRSISPVHGLTSITQNIGETKNTGLEMSLNSRNVTTNNFTWSTTGNVSFNSNEIVSLYGDLDEDGNEMDDVGNSWFIGEPISVNYHYVVDGVWQLDEADQAAEYGSQPGFIKIKDSNGDGLDPDDREIIGQTDPSFFWGLTNAFSYNGFSLNVFIHGVHGVTKRNAEMTDLNVNNGVNRNTAVKNWWTPENPTNEWVMNHTDSEYMSGTRGLIYENASFVRLRDVTLSYAFRPDFIQRIGLNRLQLYTTGRNLLTLTEWSGLDPELSSQTAIPLQREIVLGLNVNF
ncbi:MAG: TonB-dependent receptor [Balneolales bacterium]